MSACECASSDWGHAQVGACTGEATCHVARPLRLQMAPVMGVQPESRAHAGQGRGSVVLTVAALLCGATAVVGALLHHLM